MLDISQDEFESILSDFICENYQEILSIPGVYELLAEYWNNDVIEEWLERHWANETQFTIPGLSTPVYLYNIQDEFVYFTADAVADEPDDIVEYEINTFLKRASIYDPPPSP